MECKPKGIALGREKGIRRRNCEGAAEKRMRETGKQPKCHWVTTETCEVCQQTGEVTRYHHDIERVHGNALRITYYERVKICRSHSSKTYMYGQHKLNPSPKKHTYTLVSLPVKEHEGRR